MSSITDEGVIAEANGRGVKLEVLGGPGSEAHRAWSILGVGGLAVLFWTPEKGFSYRTKFGRRWKTWKCGKLLTTVLKDIEADVAREKKRVARLYAKVGISETEEE